MQSLEVNQLFLSGLKVVLISVAAAVSAKKHTMKSCTCNKTWAYMCPQDDRNGFQHFMHFMQTMPLTGYCAVFKFMQTLCRLYEFNSDSMQIPCRFHADFMQISCIPYAGFMIWFYVMSCAPVGAQDI